MKSLAGLSVFLLEDEALIAMDVEDMLLHQLEAASVTVANTLESASDIVGSQTFDVAVLDVNVNGVRSLPIAEALRSRNTPVVFSTGYSLLAQQMEGYRNDVCVQKPYSVASLHQGITDALSRASLGGTPA